MAREDPHFRLRIPAPLLEQIQKLAEVNRRSATAEIVARLEQSVALPPMDIPHDLLERMRRTDEDFRKSRGQMIVRDMIDYFPPPPPKRVVRVTTQNIIDSLERSLGKSPEVAALVDQVREKIASGEIDGGSPAEITLPAVDWNQALRGQSIYTGPLSDLAKPEVSAGTGELGKSDDPAEDQGK